METIKLEPMALWPETVPHQQGDSPEDNPTLTPYLPAGDIVRSAVIVCPGGGYSHRAPHEGEPIAYWLNSLGIAAFVLDYRVSPYRHPAPLKDAQRAIRLVRAKGRFGEWTVDPTRIGILGFSAGGHCATSAATIFDAGDKESSDPIAQQSSRPNALIACYPVITFGEYRHHGSMLNLLSDKDGQVSPELQESLSLETRVTPQTPPTFLWHTSNDPGVPVENSLMFAAALSHHKVQFALHVFPDGGHGLGLAADHQTVSVWPDLCAEWLEEIGFTEPGVSA
jgi:acetyl esterase/lipase